MTTAVSSPNRPVAVYLLCVILVLQALTALPSGALLMFDPSGAAMQFPSDVLEKLPFRSYFTPGLLLFTCLGALPLFAVYQLLAKTDTRLFQSVNIYTDYRFGWMLALFSGFATLIWITTQLYMVEIYHWLQTFYAVIGLIVLALALLPATMRYCRVAR